jgi:hypothetical protein
MTTITQRHEIEAWLGDDHDLTDEQVTELVRQAEDISERYPDHSDYDVREAALIAACRVLSGDDPVAELSGALTRARLAEMRALAGLRQAAVMAVAAGESEAGFARRAGIDRMAVRNWLGKR